MLTLLVHFYRPPYVVRGKVIFILGNVCLFTIAGGREVPNLRSGGRGRGVPHPRSGRGGYPPDLGQGSPLDLGLGPPPRALETRRAVCLLRSRRRTFLLSLISCRNKHFIFWKPTLCEDLSPQVLVEWVMIVFDV